MESKFRSNVVSEGSWIGQSFFVISIRGYTPPLRATKIYTSSPIPPRGIWHTFARHEAYNYGLDPENRFLEGRVGVPSIVPYFEPDFCRRIPLKDSFPSSFLARTHYHTSLKSFFFYLSYPRRVEGKYRGAFATFSISQESRIRFANRFKYSPSIFASCLKNNQFVSLAIKLFFTVLRNTNRVSYLHLRRKIDRYAIQEYFPRGKIQGKIDLLTLCFHHQTDKYTQQTDRKPMLLQSLSLSNL